MTIPNTTVSFSCNQIDFKDLVMCSFSLNKTEYNLFLFLLEQEDSLSASQIGEQMKKDRTTVQKAIKKLVVKDLVQKFQINLDTGGYTFVYKIRNKDFIRTTILEVINSWHRQVVETIKSW